MTVSALVLASFITGVLFIETVFAWPGLARLAVQATWNNDFPLLSGIVLALRRDLRWYETSRPTCSTLSSTRASATHERLALLTAVRKPPGRFPRVVGVPAPLARDSGYSPHRSGHHRLLW